MSGEEVVIEVEVDWRALLALAVAASAAVWLALNFRDAVLAVGGTIGWRPVSLEAEREAGGTIRLKVCVAEWLGFSEITLEVLKPDGAAAYSAKLPAGCSQAVLALVNEGFCCAVIRGNGRTLAVFQLRLTSG